MLSPQPANSGCASTRHHIVQTVAQTQFDRSINQSATTFDSPLSVGPHLLCWILNHARAACQTGDSCQCGDGRLIVLPPGRLCQLHGRLQPLHIPQHVAPLQTRTTRQNNRDGAAVGKRGTMETLHPLPNSAQHGPPSSGNWLSRWCNDASQGARLQRYPPAAAWPPAPAHTHPRPAHSWKSPQLVAAACGRQQVAGSTLPLHIRNKGRTSGWNRKAEDQACMLPDHQPYGLWAVGCFALVCTHLAAPASDSAPAPAPGASSPARPAQAVTTEQC